MNSVHKIRKINACWEGHVCSSTYFISESAQCIFMDYDIQPTLKVVG